MEPKGLECRVCNEAFQPAGLQLPRILQCGHSMCHACLLRLSVKDDDGLLFKAVYCPFDRQPSFLSEAGVYSLSKNFSLIEVIERRLQRAEQEKRNEYVTVPGCADHHGSSVDRPSTSAVTDGLRTLDLEKERRLGVPCDESETHVAVLYCTVCESNLCTACSAVTHTGRVLSKHLRLPVSQKPHAKSRCPWHANYAVEFVCQEESCDAPTPLMCLLCRDYGQHVKHKHALLDMEGPAFRNSIRQQLDALGQLQTDLQDFLSRLGSAIAGISGQPTPDLHTALSAGSGAIGLGSGALARQQVLNHFAHIREQLLVQEATALAVIDAHVCERAQGLQQCQQDLTALATDLTTVMGKTELLLLQDDTRLLKGRKEIRTLLDSVDAQRAQFLELPNKLNLETHIPVCFTKDNRVHIGPRIEMRVVSLGLDLAGKTTILCKLKQNELIPTIPTIGFNVDTLEYRNLRLTIWDVGGVPKLRPLWKHYYLNTQALIFVVDSTDVERFAEVQGELVKLISEQELKDAALLVLANKQDLPGAVSVDDMIEQLALSKLCYGRCWHIQSCSATSGDGLWPGIDWLARQLVSAAAIDHPLHMAVTAPGH